MRNLDGQKMFPYLLFTICFFSNAIFSYSHMTEDTSFGLICPDDSPAVAKGLHACCENPPHVYCVLCVLVSKSHISTCTIECNGTLLQESPHCADCVCKPAIPQDETEDSIEGDEKYRGCPFMNRKGKYKNDL